MPPLDDFLTEIRAYRAIAKENTGPQISWSQHLANVERIIVEAIRLRALFAASPADRELKHQMLTRAGQAVVAMDRVRKGVKKHRENYDAAHGATQQDKRDGWNKAYRDRIIETEGREPRKNADVKNMTPEQQLAHRREKERLKKQRQRSKVKNDSEHETIDQARARNPNFGRF